MAADLTVGSHASLGRFAMRRTRTARGQATMALLLALGFSAANAATFSVSPLRIELDASHRADMLTLRNTGDEPLRIQVRSMHWGMAGDGQWQLTPSEDLIVTPQLLEIAPGQSGQLRIGTLLAAGAQEASYRLLLDELPNVSDDKSTPSPEIRVLTQVSLPVFLEPTRDSRVPGVSSALMEHGDLVIGIGDEGARRLDPQRIKWTLSDRNGQVLEQREQMASYVLPGSTSFLHMKLPANVCQRAASVSVSWLDTSTSSSHPITTGAEACEGAYP
jgi:fimbrial chaperone protein